MIRSVMDVYDRLCVSGHGDQDISVLLDVLLDGTVDHEG
jgi:hypothetical protein